MTNLTRQDIINNILMRLGGTVIDIELSTEQLNLCIDLAIKKLRQIADGAVEESYLIYYIKQNQKEYYLPDEVVAVQQIFRRGYGRLFGSAENLDPFAYAGFSNIYLAGGLFTFGNGNGLSTYELYNNYLKTAGKMFGMYMNFNYNSTTKKLTLAENPRGDEEYIVLWCYTNKPEDELYNDRNTSYWIESWALSEAKMMLANIRGRFANMPGPNGSVQQDASEQRQDALKLQEQLLLDVKNMITGTALPPGPFLG